MKVEGYQRKQLKQKKLEEKERTEEELFRDLDEMEQKNQMIMEHQKVQQVRKAADDGRQFQKDMALKGTTITATQGMIHQQRDESTDIFGEEDIAEMPSTAGSSRTFQPPNPKVKVEEPQPVQVIEEMFEEPLPVPEVRQKQDVKVDFTEKKFAHLPARESQTREPPMPRSKKIDKKKDTVFIDVEDKDPVWLKDKGDHFYQRNDFHSALNAYSKALEHDKEFLMGRLNRATTWLRVRCFENAVEDLNDIETYIMALKDEERDNDDFYQRMLARTFLRRGAGYAWLSKFDQSVENLTEALKYKNVFTERELIEISNDVDRVKVRQKSLQLKTDGDLQFAHSNLDEAAELYRECLEIDPLNEYVLANMGLIYLMK